MPYVFPVQSWEQVSKAPNAAGLFAVVGKTCLGLLGWANVQRRIHVAAFQPFQTVPSRPRPRPRTTTADEQRPRKDSRFNVMAMPLVGQRRVCSGPVTVAEMHRGLVACVVSWVVPRQSRICWFYAPRPRPHPSRVVTFGALLGPLHYVVRTLGLGCQG
ncbi:hypothetical protein LZ30DRAFT_689460 [Colletotrichum cereale]|nr:hypothetical protein LZ30DRAFT_689460 [Colletotrichum cereale]